MESQVRVLLCPEESLYTGSLSSVLMHHYLVLDSRSACLPLTSLDLPAGSPVVNSPFLSHGRLSQVASFFLS